MGEAQQQILVLGATGQVGRAVIRHLRDDKSVEVIAAARNPQEASGFGVRVHYLELDNFDSIMPALKKHHSRFLGDGVYGEYITTEQRPRECR